MIAAVWPTLTGNIRELRNLIERATLLSNGELIDVAHLDDPAGLAGRLGISQRTLYRKFQVGRSG
ncbi:MAG: hypothetical protein FWD50_04350 [Betaproteobacteria bacterium]|nr:hypothetical protein [Betaproteobacteria bacterium]